MRIPFECGEWYHCYNRGVEKRRVFSSPADYERFIALLYVCNGTETVRLADLYDQRLESVLTNPRIDRGDPIVEIGVYALMPNHVHLVVEEVREGGIATFMQKVFTGYTMYFNKKYGHVGPLFAGVFKSKHLDDDAYLKQCVAYTLLNPAEIFDKGWKRGRAQLERLERKLRLYAFSSAPDFLGKQRLEHKIIGNALREMYDERPTLRQLLRDGHEYYREHQSSR